MNSGEDTWIIPETLARSALEAQLAQHFDLEALPEYTAVVTYVDTFDWRLYQAGLILHVHQRSWSLYANDGELILLKGGPQCKKACSIDVFPEGPMRSTLASVIGIRALLPLAEVELQGRQLHLRNGDGKIVLRLVLEEQRLPGETHSFRMARVFPLRGYDEELAAVRTLLQAQGIVEPVSPLAGFEAGCLATGRKPLDYSSKFTLALEPQLTAREAMQRVYGELLTAMRRNFPGTMADLDSEFLHDLRVAVRRTRSALSLTKGVFSVEALKPFKQGFAELGHATGPTRDLDVYLLSEEASLARLHPELRSGLQAYFTDITRQRRKAQRNMVRFLGSSRVERLLLDWERFLTATPPPGGPLADKPIIKLANRIIRKHSQQVLRDGQNLDANTPDAEIHQLRIDCKKLRYSMEFFSSLYPEDAFAQLVKPLKAVQSILGDFNDLSVQQELLAATIRHQDLHKEAKETGKGVHRNALQEAEAEQVASLGALMQSLYEQQQPLRQHFAEVFASMTSDVQLELLNSLFGKQQRQP
ncbi:MAG: CHAD domain-containing protein [Desulfobulbaceae bacterium]|nr:CHAD domain-containing protein [Desulfobulbaceae bacterium]